MSSDKLELGVVLGAHGVRGAIRVHLHAPRGDAIAVGRRLELRFGSTPGASHQARRFEAKIERGSMKPHSSQARVWLEGISSREAAELWRGATVWMSRQELPELADDEYYLADLMGLQVRQSTHPEVVLGQVESVIDNRAQDLLEIVWNGSDGDTTRWLLPAVEAYVESYDEENLWVDLPKGLLPTRTEALLTDLEA